MYCINSTSYIFIYIDTLHWFILIKFFAWQYLEFEGNVLDCQVNNITIQKKKKQQQLFYNIIPCFKQKVIDKSTSAVSHPNPNPFTNGLWLLQKIRISVVVLIN